MKLQNDITSWLSRVWVIAGLGLLGLLDATYLTVEHYTGSQGCTIGGCGVVTTSSYATIGSIPVSLLGVLYYAIILGLSLAVVATNRRDLFRKLAILTIAGLIASMYFVSLQVFAIHAYCMFCLFSALTSTLLFIWGMIQVKQIKAQ